MHYEKTNGIVGSGYDQLKRIWPSKTDADEIKLVWLFGYASHLIADATIHPIVKQSWVLTKRIRKNTAFVK